jgi:hypothetical protein
MTNPTTPTDPLVTITTEPVSEQEDVFIARAMEKEAKFDKDKVEHKRTGKTEKNSEKRRHREG